MDFFALKHKYHQTSRLFYVLFFLVVMAQSLLLMAVVGFVFGVWVGHVGVGVLVGSLAFVGLYFMIGLLIARHKIKQGGLSLAKAVGVVRLFIHHDTSQTIYTKTYIKASSVRELPTNYRRYHEFAEQMSIASGLPLPKLYVLPSEMGVNGFVAGFGESDTVLVLTQGALDKLNNHELYGLIGHEFGHLSQKDNELNLRMYAMMSALGWVYDLADIMETYVLGRFDKDYHGDDVLVDGGREDWIQYLKAQQRKITHTHAQGHINSHRKGYDTAPLFFPYLIAITPVILFRLFGVMGMASAEWVKSQFNQQREHLADAISIQLTRSDDVVMALQSLHRHDSALNNPAFTSSMSHFFFANPKPKGEWSKSHPAIDERCDMLVDVVDKFADDKSDGFSEVAFMSYEYLADEQSYNELHSFTDDRHPLLQNATTDDKGITTIKYDGDVDVVHNGRLVVNDWVKWEVPQSFLPQWACTDETLQADGDYLTLTSIKNARLPYTIASALKKPLSALALIECAMCCMWHEKVDEQVDLWAVYWGIVSDERALSHKLPLKLLHAVAHYDRRADGLLVWLSLRQFVMGRFEHLSDELDEYTHTLSSLIIKNSCINTPQICHHRPIKRLFCAFVMSLLLAISRTKIQQDVYSKTKAYLGGYELSAVLVLLIFVASTQDNSLILMRHDKVTTSIRRWARLVNVVVMVDDETLIKLCHQVRVFGVADLAVVLMAIDGGINVVETLRTAFLFDGRITQEEYEVVLLANLLWQ